jgi:site-specific recombinase XerD
MCAEVLSIPKKKVAQEPISYLLAEVLMFLLALPDSSDPRQLRALCLIALLYDSGACVSELCSVTVRELRFGSQVLCIGVIGARTWT